jgi:hypothetical protein
MKQAFITVQVDDITNDDIGKLYDLIEEALADYRRKRIQISSQKLETQPLPLEEITE